MLRQVRREPLETALPVIFRRQPSLCLSPERCFAPDRRFQPSSPNQTALTQSCASKMSNPQRLSSREDENPKTPVFPVYAGIPRDEPHEKILSISNQSIIRRTRSLGQNYASQTKKNPCPASTPNRIPKRRFETPGTRIILRIEPPSNRGSIPYVTGMNALAKCLKEISRSSEHLQQPVTRYSSKYQFV